jgi:septum formation protein
MTELILASTSATRQRLLRDAGIHFTAEAAQVDETVVLESLAAEKVRGRDAADVLAELKAVRVSGRHPGAMVIGADQVLSLGTEMFQKPVDRAAARAQLQRLRGGTHVLSSAVCVARDGLVVWRVVEEAKMTMRAFSDEFLDAYLVEAGEDILGSVGAYHVEGLGIQLFSRIDGDSFTIQGLPLLPLIDFLRTHGIMRA